VKIKNKNRKEEIIMKKFTKTLAFLAALCLLVSMFAITAMAAGSKSQNTELTIKKNGAEVGYTLGAVDGSIPPLTAELAAKLIGNGTTADQVKIMWQQDVTLEAGVTPPVDVTANVDLSAGQEGYVFHYENGAWKLMGSTNTAITFNSLSPVGVAVKTTSSSEAVANTNDSNALFAIACGAVVIVGIVGTAVTVSLKKKNEA
jgi:hypothetical protein